MNENKKSNGRKLENKNNRFEEALELEKKTGKKTLLWILWKAAVRESIVMECYYSFKE